jgi:hypothetical protein
MKIRHHRRPRRLVGALRRVQSLPFRSLFSAEIGSLGALRPKRVTSRRWAEPMPLLTSKDEHVCSHPTPPVEMNVGCNRFVGMPSGGCNFDVCEKGKGRILDKLMPHRDEERARPLRRREKIYRFVKYTD